MAARVLRALKAEARHVLTEAIGGPIQALAQPLPAIAITDARGAPGLFVLR